MLAGKMITYREDKNDIIQSVEIDLTELSIQSRQDLEYKITECLKNDKEYRDIFKFEGGNRLVYQTEVLVPKINKDRLNVLMVLGNPAVHSVAGGMFFSYERTRSKEKWREHRFWRGLRDCGVLTFYKAVKRPTSGNLAEINKDKRNWLLYGEYESDFNVFLLPYFSFPTPASGECSGVNGIKKIVGTDVFTRMEKSEFQRFEGIILCNNIKNVICFQKHALKEIEARAKCEQANNTLSNPDYPVYKLGNTLKHVTLY
ncbi:MAG: hypothetical protein HQ577_03745, partial [Dehalococcoidia bacterium]|nr:hypothetical protein [Dehalococcoidia bacterium]